MGWKVSWQGWGMLRATSPTVTGYSGYCANLAACLPAVWLSRATCHCHQPSPSLCVPLPRACVQRMPIILVKLYTYQMLRALAHIHSIGVCHRCAQVWVRLARPVQAS